jgi:hypothetical protein
MYYLKKNYLDLEFSIFCKSLFSCNYQNKDRDGLYNVEERVEASLTYKDS